MKTVIVIGGGPAGMVSAIKATEEGNKVTILEKNNMLGKKLLITGKGRCNITSSIDMCDFFSNIPRNEKFLYSAFKNYTNKDIIEFLHKEKLEVKQERGNRIFPVTDKSIDVLNCFKNKIKKQNIKVDLNTQVQKIKKDENTNQFIIKTNKEEYKADKVIIATGGKSYPDTGATGDGYEIAQSLGHTIEQIQPSLIPYEVYEKETVKELTGLSLKNVSIDLYNKQKNKSIYKDFGEMIFTHYGVSGPIIISSSAHLINIKNYEQELNNKNIILKIDLKPALSEEKLDKRIQRDFEEIKNKQFKNGLDKLLPKSLIPVIIKRTRINPIKQINEVKKIERKQIIKEIKEFTLTIKEIRPIEEAIITRGGISVKEINPKTMESKIVKGLYFAGEIIDVDAYTGGFNLQIAYSTGYTAGIDN